MISAVYVVSEGDIVKHIFSTDTKNQISKKYASIILTSLIAHTTLTTSERRLSNEALLVLW